MFPILSGCKFYLVTLGKLCQCFWYIFNVLDYNLLLMKGGKDAIIFYCLYMDAVFIVHSQFYIYTYIIGCYELHKIFLVSTPENPYYKLFNCNTKPAVKKATAQWCLVEKRCTSLSPHSSLAGPMTRDCAGHNDAAASSLLQPDEPPRPGLGGGGGGGVASGTVCSSMCVCVCVCVHGPAGSFHKHAA